MYFRPCPYCRANLDPGEACDCGKQEGPGTEAPSPHGREDPAVILRPPVENVKAAQLARYWRATIAAIINS